MWLGEGVSLFGSLDPTGAARDEVYAVDLIAWGGNWRNVGVIGYQIGRKREKNQKCIFILFF